MPGRSKSSVADAPLPSGAGLHGRTTTRTDQASLRNHAAGDAVHIRDELAAQPHGVVLAVSLLLRRSLRGDGGRHQRETIDDSKSCDQSQSSACSAVSHRGAPLHFDLYIRFALIKITSSDPRLPSATADAEDQ